MAGPAFIWLAALGFSSLSYLAGNGRADLYHFLCATKESQVERNWKKRCRVTAHYHSCGGTEHEENNNDVMEQERRKLTGLYRIFKWGIPSINQNDYNEISLIDIQNTVDKCWLLRTAKSSAAAAAYDHSKDEDYVETLYVAAFTFGGLFFTRTLIQSFDCTSNE